jgi:branched-chain amino acid transport system ATP-binding protein
VEHLDTVYGDSVAALTDINIEVNAGEFITVLGPNGAGKTTLVRSITGLLPLVKGKVVGGSVHVHGRRVAGTRTSALVASGLGIVPERRVLFPRLTVRENLLCGAAKQPKGSRERLSMVFDLFPEISRRSKTNAALLSGGEQQMVAVGRALMAEPRTLICDEISMGLAPVVVARIFETLRQMNSDGLSVLLIEQSAAAALRVADRYYALDAGRVVDAGLTSEPDSLSKVTQAYFGAGSGGRS